MPRINVSSEIRVPPQRAWELMCDAKRYGEWVIPTDEVLEAPDGPIEAGTVYREHGGIPPFKGDSEWHVTAFEPMRRQVHVGDDGVMTMTLEILMEPVDAGTKLTLDIDFEPRWFMKPMVLVMWALLMGRRGEEAMQGTIDNFKRLAEAEA